MPNLGTKYVCYSCQSKFYDLGRSTAVCPKCGADQKDAESAPTTGSTRGRRVVEEFEEEPDFEAETPEIEEEEEDIGIAPVVEDAAEEPEADDDEEEDF